MRSYLIVSHDYTTKSAGVRALHRLCHALNQHGREAWITSPVVNPDWNTPAADAETQAALARDGIVVYPEVEDGNPLDARRVVRYLLNKPGLVRPARHLEGEVRFAYCGLLRPFVSDYDHILYVPVIERDLFYPPQEPAERAGSLWWKGKEAKTLSVILDEWPEPSLEIAPDWPKTRRELADLFRGAKRFFSHTCYTALVLEARLCGCPTVVFPNEHWSSRIEFQIRTPAGMAGLAWGMDNFRWAENTIHMFPPAYDRLAAQFPAMLDRFIRITQRMEVMP